MPCHGSLKKEETQLHGGGGKGAEISKAGEALVERRTIQEQQRVTAGRRMIYKENGEQSFNWLYLSAEQSCGKA